jgi:glycosyltransferase involved in cell wall biosynthesis
MKLSILIPTLNEQNRRQSLRRLLAILQPQVNKYPGDIEILINDAGRSVPTGTKRNNLIQDSQGDYFCFIDDDDLIPEYYVDELIKAIDQEPDVVTFIGYMTTSGRNKQHFTIKLGSDYAERNNHYYRYPNHLCCFNREKVKGVRFEPIWQSEDFKWATEIMRQKLLKTEVHIEKWMYWYDFIPNKRRR